MSVAVRVELDYDGPVVDRVVLGVDLRNADEADEVGRECLRQYR